VLLIGEEAPSLLPRVDEPTMTTRGAGVASDEGSEAKSELMTGWRVPKTDQPSWMEELDNPTLAHDMPNSGEKRDEGSRKDNKVSKMRKTNSKKNRKEVTSGNDKSRL
jgi:hypothetical protein